MPRLAGAPLPRRGSFTYRVVPRGQARIRVQVSAAHTREELAGAAMTFEEVARQLGVLS